MGATSIREAMPRGTAGERGSVIVISMLAMVALASLGGLTILSVRGGLASAGHGRFQAVALYAAESGVAIGIDHLRRNLDPVTNWGTFVVENNSTPQTPSTIAGNQVKPGQTGNIFSADLRAWYEVTILNNVGDPGLGTGADNDARVILRSTGHGPDGSSAIIEVEVLGTDAVGLGRPCPAYGQKGMGEDGAGRNDCLSVIDSSDVATFSPNGS